MSDYTSTMICKQILNFKNKIKCKATIQNHYFKNIDAKNIQMIVPPQ